MLAYIKFDVCLSVRAENCLRNEGINTLAALRGKTDAELLRIPNLGRRTFNELRRIQGQFDKIRLVSNPIKD